MTAVRTFTRSAAVLGAATALTVAGAGAAMATTHNSEVDGNTVSVTFKLDGGLVDADVCGAVVTQVADAAGVAAEFAKATDEANLIGVLTTLAGNDSVHVLAENGLVLDTPITVLGGAAGIGKTSGTVEVHDLPSNVYALVSVCVSEPTKPTINPFVLVGNPLEAVMGSVESGSDAGNLAAGSTILESALGGDNSGLGGVLSSAIGGGDEGGLDALSSAMGDDE